MFPLTFMLVLALSNGVGEHKLFTLSGFGNYARCADVREWVLNTGYYKDEEGVWWLDSVNCEREFINET